MNVDQFKAEYFSFTQLRRQAGLQALFDTILSDINQNEEVILDILDIADMAEANDYFGTEGLNI